MRHFLDIKDFDKDRLTALLETARDMKSGHDMGRHAFRAVTSA